MEYYIIVGALSILIILLSASIHKTHSDNKDKKNDFKTLIAGMALFVTSGALGYYIYSNFAQIHPNDEMLVDMFLRMDEY